MLGFAVGILPAMVGVGYALMDEETGLVPEITSMMHEIPKDLPSINKQLETLLAAQEGMVKEGKTTTAEFKNIGRQIGVLQNEQAQHMIDDSLLKASARSRERLARILSPESQTKIGEMLGHPDFLTKSPEFISSLKIFAKGNKEYMGLIDKGDYAGAFRKMLADATGAKPNVPRAQKLYDALSSFFHETVKRGTTFVEGPTVAARVGPKSEQMVKVIESTEKARIIEFFRQRNLGGTPEGLDILNRLASKAGPGNFDIVQSLWSDEYFIRHFRGDRTRPFYQHVPEAYGKTSRVSLSTSGSARIARALSTDAGVMPADLLLLRSAALNKIIPDEDISLYNQLMETKSGNYLEYKERFQGTPIGEINEHTVTPIEAFGPDYMNLKTQAAVVGREAVGGRHLIRSSKRAYTQILENLAKNKVDINPENIELLKNLGITPEMGVGLWRPTGGRGDILKALSESVLKEQSNLARSSRTEIRVVAKATSQKLLSQSAVHPEFNANYGFMSNRIIEMMGEQASERLGAVQRLHDIKGLVDALEGQSMKLAGTGKLARGAWLKELGRTDLTEAQIKEIDDLIASVEELTGEGFTQKGLIAYEKEILKYRNLGRTLSGSGHSAVAEEFLLANVSEISLPRELRDIRLTAKAVYGKESAAHIRKIIKRFADDSKATDVHKLLEDHFARSARARKNFGLVSQPAEVQSLTSSYFKQFIGEATGRKGIMRALKSPGAKKALHRLGAGLLLPGEAIGYLLNSPRLERVLQDPEVTAATLRVKPGAVEHGQAATVFNQLMNQELGIKMPESFGIVHTGEIHNRLGGEVHKLGSALKSFIKDLRGSNIQESVEAANVLEQSFFDKSGNLLVDFLVPEAENDPGLAIREQMSKNRTEFAGAKDKIWATSANAKTTIVDTLTSRLGTHMNFSKEAFYAMRGSGIHGLMPYILEDVKGFDASGYEFVRKMSDSIRTQTDTMKDLKAVKAEDVMKGTPYKGMGSEEFQYGWKYQSQLTKDALDQSVEHVKDSLAPDELAALRKKVQQAKRGMVSTYYAPGEATGLKGAIAKAAERERMAATLEEEIGIHIPDIDKTISRVARAENTIMELSKAPMADKAATIERLQASLDSFIEASHHYSHHPVLNPFTKHGVLDKYGQGIKNSFMANIRLSEMKDTTQLTDKMSAAEKAALSADPVATLTEKMARKAGISEAEIARALKTGDLLEGALVGYRDPITHVAAFRTRVVRGKGEGFVRITMGPTQMAMADFDKDRFAFKYISPKQQANREAARKAIEEAFANQREFYAKVKPLAGKFKDIVSWSPMSDFYKSFTSELEAAKGTLEGEWRSLSTSPARKAEYEALMTETKKAMAANPEAAAVGTAEEFARNQFMGAKLAERGQKVLLGQATIPFASQTRRLMESLVYASGNYSQATLRATEAIGVTLQQVPIKEYKHGLSLEGIQKFSEEMKEVRKLIGSPDPEKITAGFERIGKTQMYQGIIRENLGLAAGEAVTPEHIKTFFSSEKMGNVMGTLTDYAARDKASYGNVTDFTNTLIGREGNLMGKIRQVHGEVGSASFEEMRTIAAGQGHKFPGVGATTAKEAGGLAEAAIGATKKVKTIAQKLAKHPAVALGALGSIAALGLAGALQSPTNSAPLVPPSPVDKSSMNLGPMSLADKRYDMSGPPGAQRRDDEQQGSIWGTGVGPNDMNPNSVAQKVQHAYPNSRINVSVQHHPGGGPSVRTARRIKGM